MAARGKKLLLCDCEKTMALDEQALSKALEGSPEGKTQLCRTELEAFRQAIAEGDSVLVACTQEAPLFKEVAGEKPSDTKLAFTNIRESAGWSEAGAKARSISFIPTPQVGWIRR